MRKWLVLGVLLMLSTMAFSTSGDPVGTIETEPAATLSDGGGMPVDPFEAMADTTADIYIYVTLRQPAGPPADPFWIELTNCTAGSEYVRFKTLNPPGAGTAVGDFYIMYRAQWGLFQWSDVMMFGLDDIRRQIDPLEDPFGFSDLGQYRWTTGITSWDYFRDSLITPTATRGVCDPDTNYFYTKVGVDSTDDGRLLYSPIPARPVGEFDQMIYPGENILTLPVDIQDSTAKEIGERLHSAGVRSMYRWLPATQTWSLLAAYSFSAFPPPGSWSWSGATTALLPGACFRADKTDGVTAQMWSTYSPGYLPYDADLPVHTLTKFPTRTTGINYVMLPYQEYNILLSSVGSFPVMAKYLLMDIPCAGQPNGKVYMYNNSTHTMILLAQWSFSAFPPPGSWQASGATTPVYPGRPYIIEVQGECTWPLY